MRGEEINRLFGENVRRQRRARGWSQEQFAERSGMHRTFVGSIERGEANVTLATVEKAAAALGVSPASLLAEPENPGGPEAS